MDQEKLFLVGVSHFTAPVSSREKLAVAAKDLAAAIGALKEIAGLSEVLVLSTCSRVEVYGVSSDPSAVEQVELWFLRRGGCQLYPSLYVHRGGDALRHIFSVTSGLDSWIIGETEILGQVKKSYQIALAERSTGSLLNRVFQRAIAAGKAVRHQTGIQNGIRSIGGAAALLARRIFDEKKGGAVIVFGAGEAAEAVAKHLIVKNFEKIYIANRTFSRAAELAYSMGGTPVGIQEGLALLSECEIAIFSTSADKPVLDLALMSRVMRTSTRSKFLIDLSIPRNVEPACGGVDNVYLYDLEDLQSIVAENMKDKAPEKEHAEVLASLLASECIVEIDKAEYRRGRAAVPTEVL